MRAALFALAFVLLFAACRGERSAPLADLIEDAPTPTTAAALDSLDGGMVSVNGRVADHTRGERTLVLDDGTGLIRVHLPEEPPPLVGHRLFVRGEVRQDDGAPLIEAFEWLYDSTAVSIHSD